MTGYDWAQEQNDDVVGFSLAGALLRQGWSIDDIVRCMEHGEHKDNPHAIALYRRVQENQQRRVLAR